MVERELLQEEHPIDEAARLAGGRDVLAHALGVSVAAIGNWKTRGVPLQYCPRIERLVPSVTRARLRPSDYMEMWPELAFARTGVYQSGGPSFTERLSQRASKVPVKGLFDE